MTLRLACGLEVVENVDPTSAKVQPQRVERECDLWNVANGNTKNSHLSFGWEGYVESRVGSGCGSPALPSQSRVTPFSKCKISSPCSEGAWKGDLGKENVVEKSSIRCSCCTP